MIVRDTDWKSSTIGGASNVPQESRRDEKVNWYLDSEATELGPRLNTIRGSHFNCMTSPVLTLFNARCKKNHHFASKMREASVHSVAGPPLPLLVIVIKWFHPSLRASLRWWEVIISLVAAVAPVTSIPSYQSITIPIDAKRPSPEACRNSLSSDQ